MVQKKDPVEAAAEAQPLTKDMDRKTARAISDAPEVLTPEQAQQTLHELRVHQIELELQNEELRRAQAELEAAQARYFDLYNMAPIAYLTVSDKGLIIESNLTTATLLGSTRTALLKQPFSAFIHKDDQDIYYLHRKQTIAAGSSQECELRMHTATGTSFWAHLQSIGAQDTSGDPVCRTVLSDITERRFRDEERVLTGQLMVTVNSPNELHECLSAITLTLKGWSGCEAVGIRLRSEEDFPYYETRGFPPEFVHEENQLCSYGSDREVLRDTSGNPVLECMCGNILSGRFDPAKPFFTAHGSFWSNNTTALLASTTEADRQARTRNRCNGEGYESVALVPLRGDGEVFGLVQFNDRRVNRFTPELIASFERMADTLAIALSRRQASVALRESEAQYRQLFESASDALFLISTETGKIIDANQVASMLYGYDHDELCGMRSHDLSAEPEETQRLTQEGKNLSDGVISIPTRLHRKKDGTVFPVEISARKLILKALPLLLVAARDITERKQMEDVQIFLAQASSGTRAEPFFNRLARYLAEKLSMDFVCIDRLEGTGLNARTVAVWCDGHFEDNVTYALKDTPCGDVVGNLVCCFPANVCQFFPRDQVLGDLRAESYVGVTLFSHTGQPIGLIAVIGRTPLSSRALAEATLKLVAVRAAGEMERLDAEDVLQQVAAKIPGAVYQLVRRPDGKFEVPFISEGAGLLMGKPLSELMTIRGILDSVHPDDVKELKASLLESAKSTRRWDFEFRIVESSGTIKWLHADSNPSALPDGSLCWNGAILDITERKRAQEALRESATRLRMTSEAANVGLWDWDLLTNHIHFSTVWKRQIGFEDHEIADTVEEWQSRVHPDDAEVAIAHVQDFLKAPYPNFENEFRFRHKDGSYRTILAYADIHYGEDGKPSHMLGSHIDITERKLAEESLRESEARYRAVAQSANDAIVTITGDGTIVGWNASAEKLFGYAEAEILGKPMSLIVPPQYREAHRKGMERVQQGGEIHMLGKTVELSGLRKDGSEFLLELSLSTWDISGRTFFTGIIRDITERRRMEMALRESEQQMKAILNHSATIAWAKDIDGRHVFVSPNFERRFFIHAGDWVGKTDFELWPREIAEKFRANDLQVLKDGQPQELIEEAKNADGSTSWWFVLKFVYDGAYGEKLIGGLGVDITARKQAEEDKANLETQLQQAQKMESIGRLAGGVAHDFNNMLGVIIGHAELAIGDLEATHPLYADLEEIHKAANRSADLTRQLLAFARKQTIAPQPLDLNVVVAGTLKMLHRLIGENVTLKFHPSANLWFVNMDPSQVDQILANLCVNARDAISDIGMISIDTENHTFDASYCEDHSGFVPGDYVRISISDNGSGMEKETLAHIFEPFFTTKGLGMGTGLGLATVYGAVRQNNGFINAYSEPAHGTTFSIYLPRLQDEAAHARSEKLREAPLRGNETILLVEDEPSILALTARLLELQGYGVITAQRAEEALRLAREHTGVIHLLLTDVVMPDMNGCELEKKTRQLHPAIRCLFMSGYTADVIAHHGVLAEGVHFIQKPFSTQALALKVRMCLADTR